MTASQAIDKTNVFRQFIEGFGQAFSKACAVEAAEASSRSAERENLLNGVFFDSFLLRLRCQKKAADVFAQPNG